MNQEKDSQQHSFYESEEQTSVSVPCRPKIPYELEKSFVPTQDNASYLAKQPIVHKRYRSINIGTSHLQFQEHQCCDKFEQATQIYEKSIKTQLDTIAEFNILIDEHSKLLEHVLRKRRDDDEENLASMKAADNTKELSEKLKLINQWKAKYEQQQKINLQKDVKIRELRSKLEAVEEEYETHSQASILTDQVNTWKNKFFNLDKNHQETVTKLELLGKELENLKSVQSSLRDSGLQETTTTTKTLARKRQSVKFDIKA